MEAAIKNIASFTTVGNLTVNHLMERVCPDAMLFKFVMSKDRQVALWECKGLAGTKLGLDEDLTPTQ